MSIRILATADIHIGRRPSKVLDSGDAARFSCARIWEAIVDRAIAESVDLVLLAGDVVEHDNRFFEATGPFEAGLAKLADAGIDTWAVAGNHDHDVLSRIVDTVGSDRLHLLGRGGDWEEAVIEKDGRPVLKIHGWSFPNNHVQESPLADYNLQSTPALPDRSGLPDLPTLGLLHADLDAQGSRYGPVTRAELSSTAATIWVLGHVHASRYIEATSGPAILYPGSPQAMDPGETGRHGPWLIEIQGPRQVSATLLPMSRVRYDGLEIDLSGITSEDEFQSRVVTGINQYLKSTVTPGDGLEYVSLRLEFVGRTTLCSRLDGFSDSLIKSFEPRQGQVRAVIDTVTNNTLPAIDLDELAENHDPPGVLARTLKALESNAADETVANLVQATHRKMLEVHAAVAYSVLTQGDQSQEDQPPDREAARRQLIRQARLRLDRLLTPAQSP